MPTTATRLITLILLLQNRPNQKAAEIAAALDVSVRTLHRYMAMLEEMGIPVYAERGPNGGFSLVRGYRMPPLVLSPEEAAAVALGTRLVREVWGPLYDQAARAAQAKIERVLPEDQREAIAWAQRALAVSGLNRADFSGLAGRLEALRGAIREQQRVALAYRGSGRETAEQRAVDPYALAHRWGWWYVIGFCQSRQAVRVFRVDRIEQLERLPQSFQRPAGFDAADYIAREWQLPAPLVVRMRFAPEVAHVARDNRLLWETIAEQPGGAVEVTFLAADEIYAASTALAYGPGVAVLEPESIRRKVRAWAAEIAAQYPADA